MVFAKVYILLVVDTREGSVGGSARSKCLICGTKPDTLQIELLRS